ncbi:MAG TPA: ATP-binding protein [Bacteroidota bacterium]|nr:ATP-binding protein [Bacteroidota bacterium]
MTYIPRVLEKTVSAWLKSFPVVGITGPRQSGKSTMLKKLLGDTYEYVTFDDFRMIDQFHSDPEKFMRMHDDRVIFDEVQRVPEIFQALKLSVDRERGTRGKFILTGSGQFAFMKNVSESLAGRIGLLTLLPFQHSEVPARLRDESLYLGGYPELVTRGYDSSEGWFSSYLETYLNRDLRDLYNIGDMRDFRRCVQMLASRTAQILNMSDLARDIGITVPTVKKWVSVLEASHIIFLLPPFYKNMGKRISKSPKVYFHDTGIVSYLTGVRNAALFETGPMYGQLFENYIVADILKRELHTSAGGDLYYIRTNHGVEVDLIVDRKSEAEYIEIKTSETFRSGMVSSIEKIKGKKEKGYLVYRGRSAPYDGNISIVNYAKFLTG